MSRHRYPIKSQLHKFNQKKNRENTMWNKKNSMNNETDKQQNKEIKTKHKDEVTNERTNNNDKNNRESTTSTDHRLIQEPEREPPVLEIGDVIELELVLPPQILERQDPSFLLIPPPLAGLLQLLLLSPFGRGNSSIRRRRRRGSRRSRTKARIRGRVDDQVIEPDRGAG